MSSMPKLPHWVVQSWHMSAVVTMLALVLVVWLVWRGVESSDRNGQILERSQVVLDSTLIEFRYFTGLLRRQDSIAAARARDTAR